MKYFDFLKKYNRQCFQRTLDLGTCGEGLWCSAVDSGALCGPAEGLPWGSWQNQHSHKSKLKILQHLPPFSLFLQCSSLLCMPFQLFSFSSRFDLRTTDENPRSPRYRSQRFSATDSPSHHAAQNEVLCLQQQGRKWGHCAKRERQRDKKHAFSLMPGAL